MDLENRNVQMEGEEENARLGVLSSDVFDNRIIVEKISRMLHLQDFKTLRQLGRRCYSESAPVWNKQTCVRFDYSKDSGVFIADFNNFIEQMYGIEESGEASANPFQNFSLKGMHENSVELRTFANMFARQIKHLEIIDFYPNNAAHEDFSTTLRILTAHTESLYVRFTDKYRHQDPFCQEIFSVSFPNTKQLKLSFSRSVNVGFVFRFPNLEKLVVNDTCPRSHDWGRLLTSRATAVRMSNERARSMLSLTSLDLSGSIFDWCDLNLLVAANFPLRHLALNLWTDERNNMSLSSILNHYGSILITLKLSKKYKQGVPPYNLVPLSIKSYSLIELTLSGNVENSLDFLKHTPVLAKLEIILLNPEDPLSLRQAAQPESDIVQSSRHLLRSPHFSVPSLREFKCDRVISLTSRNTLRQWMPNLQVFEVPSLD